MPDSIFLAEIARYERFFAMVKFPTWGFREREAGSAPKIVHTVQSLPAPLGAFNDSRFESNFATDGIDYPTDNLVLIIK